MKDSKTIAIAPSSPSVSTPLVESTNASPSEQLTFITVWGKFRPEIIFRKGNTKGKLGTRCIPTIEDLRLMLLNYYPSPRTWFYFPGVGKTGHLSPDSASRILRKACNKVGVQGVSTHSFRRTALTLMSNEGIPLRIIQEISGHRSLAELQKYLEVSPDQVRGAVSALSMLSPVQKSRFPDDPQKNTKNSPKNQISSTVKPEND